MNVKKNVILFTGARSDFGLQKNIIKELKKKKIINLKIIAGPDHFDKRFGSTYKEIIDSDLKIDFKIRPEKKNIFKTRLTNLFKKSNILLDKKKFDCAILLGDRYETFLFATSCYLNKIPIIHLYGGEKTYGAIDESLRHCITKLSYYHFVSSKKNKKRVIQLGENSSNIFNCGYTGVENFLTVKLKKKKELFNKYNIKNNKKVALVTFHPETISNISYKKQIDILINAISRIKEVVFLFNINNSDPGSEIFLNQIKKIEKYNKNLKILKSLGVNDYASFVNISNLVIGNSSSGVIEVPFLNKYSINIGDRQEGREIKSSVICVKLNSKDIKHNINKYLNKKLKKKKYKIIKSSKLISDKIYLILKNNKITFKKKIFYDKKIS
jgi:GDP/UDP-N,N'-diacetylbacillosamine 2-epimerase (hydrolysing)